MPIYHHHHRRQQQQVDQVEEEAVELLTFRVVEVVEVVHLFQEVEAVVEERMIELEDREAVVEVLVVPSDPMEVEEVVGGGRKERTCLLAVVEVAVERLGQKRWVVRALQAEVVQVYDDW